jgi:porin
VKAGIIDLNSEFNVSSVSGLFLNGAQGLGLELGQVGANGPSVYPAPRLGLVGASDGPDGLRVGVFDGIAELGGPRRGEGPFVVHGLLTIAEATGPIPGGGRISLGVWRHEAGYGSTLDPIRTAAATGAYLLADGPIWEGGSRALRGLVRIGLADPKTEQIATHLTADLVLDKPFSGADGEALGLGVVSARNGAHAVRRGELQGPPLAKAETAIELSYRCPVSANVFLQPDLQYVVHPGGVAGRGDALVAGIRVGFSWSAGRR